MAISPALLSWEPTFKWKNHLYHHSPPHAPFPRIKIRKSLKNLSIKCFFTAANTKRIELLTSDRETNKNGLGKMETKQNPIEIVAKTIVKVLQKSAAAALLVGVLLMYNPYNNNSALAASGGRMGGRSCSSGSSRSSSGGRRTNSEPPSDFEAAFVAYGMLAFAVLNCIEFVMRKDTEETSVLKLQVGLVGSARSLQKDLNRIAETADTSTPKGLHHVLTETVLALLRYPDYCIYADSYVDVKRSKNEGEKRFKILSDKECHKFDELTLVNFNNFKQQSLESRSPDGCSNDGYIVITILVAAEGGLELPTINNSNDLKEALQKMASIPSRKLAVEVLWTPQKEEDNTLSKQQLLQDYPFLRPL